MTRIGPLLLAAALLGCRASEPPLEPVRIASDARSFVLAETGRPFVPWGLNYDRDATGRLLEEIWDDDWSTLEADFREMRQLGANVVRIHLQLGRFLESASEPNRAALEKLARVLALAERTRVHLIVTGLGSYRREAIPAWYAALGEAERWAVQARFWEAVAETGADSPAIFAYDLMNQPLAPARPRTDGDWLGPNPGGDLHRSQWIALDAAGRWPHEIARAWIRRLRQAIDRHDPDRLVTVGLVSWSLPRGRARSGFEPRKIASELDFLSVGFHPDKRLPRGSLRRLRGFAVGKPLVVVETSTVRCTIEELEEFVTRSREFTAGHLGFYRGRMPDELDETKPAHVATRQWLDYFRREAFRLKDEDASAPR
ncbi:MAG: cellulase family glycosylhydrolase [Myxococcota bacterium]